MRDNLAFFNVKETENEQTNTEDLVNGIIKDKMGIEENVEFEKVHRMGAKWKRSGERRIRPIVAKFSSHKMKEKVKFAGKNLATTKGGSPRDDLCDDRHKKFATIFLTKFTTIL